VPLEAMACEIPVLGTRSGGVTEVVVDGETGFLCEVGDIEAMAARAIDILTNPDLTREMGRKGRERVEQHFGKDMIVDQYEALYHELLCAPTAAK
jgi:glycosyltransferase involved in cell wall biosynthesis